MTEYTKEERERAAEQLIVRAYEMSGENTPDMQPYIEKDIAHILANRRPVGANVALAIQCQVNRLLAREAEARELLGNAGYERSIGFWQSGAGGPEGWDARREAWLAQKPEGA